MNISFLSCSSYGMSNQQHYIQRGRERVNIKHTRKRELNNSGVFRTTSVVCVVDLGLEDPGNVVCGEDTDDVADLQSEFDGGETGWEVVGLRWSNGHRNKP